MARSRTAKPLTTESPTTASPSAAAPASTIPPTPPYSLLIRLTTPYGPAEHTLKFAGSSVGAFALYGSMLVRAVALLESTSAKPVSKSSAGTLTEAGAR